MSFDADSLARLLPSIVRLRDSEQGEPLAALLRLFARELEALEEDIEQLYDDQFIETCEDWVVPYIGDLIGYRSLHGTRVEVASPRAEVANTIAYRRRKGTALMLEQLAHDLGDRPAHVAEFFEQLAGTQYMKHLRPQALATAPLRSQAAMRALGGPFNRVAHTIEVRRPPLQRPGAGGRYNIPNVGLFLWRLLPLPLSNVDLVADPGDPGGTRYRLNPLGADLALFRNPLREASIASLSEPVHVAGRLRIRQMAADVRAAQAPTASDELRRRDGYGYRDVEGESDRNGESEGVVLWRPAAMAGEWEQVPLEDIVIADLRDLSGGDWNHQDAIPPGRIGLDPERGRVVLGSGMAMPLRASFHQGAARAIGGGEYARTPPGETLDIQHRASAGEDLQPHLDEIADGGRLIINDSLTYAGTPQFSVAPAGPGGEGRQVIVAARDGARPLLASAGDLSLDIAERGELVLDGLVIGGGALLLPDAGGSEPRHLRLRHCTLVPGHALDPTGNPTAPGAPSLVIADPLARVTLEQCIVGPLQVVAGASVELIDCIVDAGGASAVAYQGIDIANAAPGGDLSAVACTVIGKVHAQRVMLASDSLFFARLDASDDWPAAFWIQRTQEGCVRFCWLPADAIAPRRYRCLPDATHPDVRPHFASLRYGQPQYLQLRGSTADAIFHGASDEGEIGVMHALEQPLREANLRIRLDEYLRHGLSAGLYYAT